MIVVAFYTVRTPYEQEIKNLEATCKKFDLKYHFEGYEGRGNWTANCAIKPEFLLEMLGRFPGEDLLYVDADAEFRKPPILVDELGKNTDVDIAAHIMTGGVLLSGTIYLRNNEKTRQLVLSWINLQRNWPDRWDQRTLHETIVNDGPRLGIVFKELPKEYTKIFDKPWGDPVIQHNQKSRQYKNLVNESILKGVPSMIEGQRVTVHPDGSFTIRRNNRAAEAFMDKNFRRAHGELRWFKMMHPGKALTDLEPIFRGKKCYIIGKGPSLDDLTEQAFDDDSAPIVCINEAIHKVETLAIKNPIFALQQDMGLRDTCQPIRGSIIVSVHAQHWYADVENRYVYNPDTYDLKSSQLSVICAIAIAQGLGAKSFDLISFDACVKGSTTYAKCIGYASSKGGDPNRFLKHRKHIETALRNWPVNWVIPTLTPSSTFAGTQPQP
jgi:hypothetical protein